MESQAYSLSAMPDDVQQRMAPSGYVCLALLPQYSLAPQGINRGLLLESSLMCLGKR
jgi:hypothetical protein